MAGAHSSFLELVGRLHEGVVDDQAWTSGLDAVCRMIGCYNLLFGAVTEGRLGSLLGHRVPREIVDSVGKSFCTADDNPWVAAVGTERLRRPITTQDLGGQEALERTRMWKEFYRPFAVGELAGSVLERQLEFSELVMIGRPLGEPTFQSAELKVFEKVIPHLARAWRVKRALTQLQGLTGTLRHVLDRLDRAIVVAGPDGQIRFANRAADLLLSRGDGIDARHGRIRATRHDHTEALLSMIRRAAETGMGGEAVAVDALSVPSEMNDRPLAIVAEPLAPPHSDALGHSPDPGAILFISDAEASTRPPVQRLRIVYGLTPAEARLTAMMVEGHGLASAAAKLGLSPNTAKYHLKTVFEKVGVTRQAQLVRRVLADVGGLAEPEKMVPSERR